MGLGSGAFRTGSCRRALRRTRTGGPLAAATCLTVQHPCAWRVVQMLSGGRASPGPQSGCGLGVLTAPPGNPVSASRDVLQGGSSGERLAHHTAAPLEEEEALSLQMTRVSTLVFSPSSSADSTVASLAQEILQAAGR